MAQIKLLEMKTTMSKIKKNTLDRTNSRTDITEQIRVLAYIMIETFQNETHREQRLKIK